MIQALAMKLVQKWIWDYLETLSINDLRNLVRKSSIKAAVKGGQKKDMEVLMKVKEHYDDLGLSDEGM